MADTFFFSDVHLGMEPLRAEKQKEQKLLSFLDYVGTEAKRLFIVGDLFEFWFEYRTVIPRGYTRVISALYKLQELGLEMHYITGNHDFWMRDFLENELNINIHFDAMEYNLDGKRFYIHHGDGLAQNDVGYRILKRILRSKINIFLYGLLHPDVGIPFAKWISHLSRHHNPANKILDDSDYLKEALKKFQEGYDYVIFGHLHMPAMQVEGEKTYVNLGDWISHFTYATYDGQNLELQKWR